MFIGLFIIFYSNDGSSIGMKIKTGEFVANTQISFIYDRPVIIVIYKK